MQRGATRRPRRPSSGWRPTAQGRARPSGAARVSLALKCCRPGSHGTDKLTCETCTCVVYGFPVCAANSFALTSKRGGYVSHACLCCRGAILSGLGQKRKAEQAPAAAPPAVRRGVLDTMLLGGDSESGSGSEDDNDDPS